MGIYILAAAWVWVLIGLLYGILSYIRKKDFRETINENPLLSTVILILIGCPIVLKNIVIPILINIVGFLLGWERKKDEDGK